MLQIGIMGSDSDLKYNNEVIEYAKEIGRIIAKSNNILVYGAEKTCSSLSTEAAMEASKNGGITMGITYGSDKNIYGKFKPTTLVTTGLGLGGGREYSLVLSCDVIIAIGGGSGTLNEICIAYQNNIPIVTINKYDGWAKKLSNKYLDIRKRLKCISIDKAEDAVEVAIRIGNKYKTNK